MKNLLTFITLTILITLFMGCNGINYLDNGNKLNIEEVDPEDPGEQGTVYNPDNPFEDFQNIPGDSEDGLHPLFSAKLGVPISPGNMGTVDPDPTGLSPSNDYDGDGIINDFEISTNPYVADYPKIVTRISAPITMEIRVKQDSHLLNHTETIEGEELKDTITNSMEDRQYAQANQKTTPYVTKEQYANSGSHSEAYGYSNSDSSSFSISGKSKVKIGKLGSGSASFSFSKSQSSSRSENSKIADSFSRSDMSEKTVFEDVDYVDNLDRNGVEFTNETVKNITTNYRKNTSLKEDESIGPNAGVVRAALFIKNLTVNMPARISNILCTLSFRTPAGEFLPVKTFRLRNDDWSVYEQDIYGGEEFGPFTIEIADLNTYEVKKALANGYLPQIHVVSYDLRRVDDSNYNPGVENLKIVEETAKGRTATIKIVGRNIREIYKVAAFDVAETDENGQAYAADDDRRISPGISLKKALFNILRNRVGDGEEWTRDNENRPLTISDKGLYWKSVAIDPENYTFIDEKDENGGANPDGKPDNLQGNSWRMFETYIKSYTDELGNVHRIETIKRIGELEKYNPFIVDDNPLYNPSELLSINEIRKMKYWVIFHNGRYYEGNINDPIWAGERYEIVCLDLEDFNNHFENYIYTPFQSLESLNLDTRWNHLTNPEDDEFARAVYLGKVLASDIIHLEVDLLESRLLFEEDKPGSPADIIYNNETIGGAWFDFNYNFQDDTAVEKGIPKDFGHRAFGGINSISVAIDESEYAHYYEITYCTIVPQGETPVCRTVKKTSEELSQNEGVITINSLTFDIQDIKIDDIPGGNYRVTVKAYSEFYKDYSLDVYTGSIDNNNPDKTDTGVADPSAVPAYFTYKATGQKNYIDVMIGGESNTEYFDIYIYGPLNYPNDNITAPEPVPGHAGMNRVPIATPSPNDGSMHPSDEPGAYRIEVFASNKNSDPVEAANREQFVTVEYERYEAQKVFSPGISATLFNQRVIDLELNFNDGSGWHRIMLAGDDYARNTIDCRFTNYVEYNKQKFHIYVKPPTGAAGEKYNVFIGGREEADVYIRTVAEQKYRDTFWLKDKNLPALDPFDPGADYIGLRDTGVTDFAAYWIKNPLTDATQIEATHKLKIFSNVAVFAEESSNSFGLKDGGIDDYFFSPMEHRKYSIKASLTDTPPDDTQNAILDAPVFKARRIGSKILFSDFVPTKETQYAIFYIVGGCDTNGCKNDFVTVEDASIEPWQRPSDNGILDVSSGSEASPLNYVIEGLPLFEPCAVAVIGYNYQSVSNPVFVEFDSAGNIVELEAASNTVNQNGFITGFGSFGDMDAGGPGVLGRELVNRNEEPISALFNEGDSMAGVFDVSREGPYDQDKFIRIFENGLSATDMDTQDGLHLTPVYKSFADGVMSPPQDQLYIDPDLGQFIMPGPVYWERCEDASNITASYEIAYSPVTYGSIYEEIADGLFYGTAYFGNLPGKNGVGNSISSITPYQDGDVDSRGRIDYVGALPSIPEKGTMSIWTKLNFDMGLDLPTTIGSSMLIGYPEFTASSYLGLMFSNSHVKGLSPFGVSLGFLCEDYSFDSTYNEDVCSVSSIENDFHLTLWFGASREHTVLLFDDSLFSDYVVNSTCNAACDFDTWHHIYVVWDESKGLDNGTKSIRVFLDGKERLWSVNDLPGSDGMPLYYAVQSLESTVAQMDNVKIWNHIIFDPAPEDEDANGVAQEILNIANIEDALHPIYGASNGYKPDLTSEGSGVGYHYIDE